MRIDIQGKVGEDARDLGEVEITVVGWRPKVVTQGAAVGPWVLGICHVDILCNGSLSERLSPDDRDVVGRSRCRWVKAL
jgi:hypothetical protein